MQKEIDLLSFLSRVTEKNTKHYRSDFLYDSRKLQEAAQAAAPEERCFFWMSRPSGTWCVLEREAFIRGSSAHNIWTHYADEPEGIIAYRMKAVLPSRSPLRTTHGIFQSFDRKTEASNLCALRCRMRRHWRLHSL